MASFNLLLVCTGNTCRSPMAEALARQLLKDKPGVSVSSAGVYAGTGSAASPEAVAAMRERGLDLSAHRSRPLTPQMLAEADQVYTMTGSHRRAVLELVPESELKVQRLDADADVADPMGGTAADYREAAEQILRALRRRLQPEPSATASD
jgi:protein-tyrosine phosphatase